MKKALAVLLSLVMVFALCVPSFAEGESSFIDEISQTVSSILAGFGNIDIGGFIDGIINGGEESTLPELTYNVEDASKAANLIGVLQSSGLSKAEIQTLLDEKLASGEITQSEYDLLIAALAEADETPTNGSIELPEVPSIEIPDENVTEAAQSVIAALKQAGVTDEQLQGVVDQLYERGIVPENVYNEITNIINASEATTAASNEGGIGSFLGGIVDTIKGFLGLGGDENTGDGDGSNSTPGNSSDFGAKDPTGDTALISVAAVAAVAGVALVLTKKKQK